MTGKPQRIGRIILVHGAAHGAWCWEMLAPLLTSYGYEVQTLDLPGLGEDVTPDTGEPELRAFAAQQKGAISLPEPMR